MDAVSLHAQLTRIASNHAWTWSSTARAVLDAVPGAAPDRHPFATVRDLGDEQLAVLAADPDFVEAVEAEADQLAAVIAEAPVPDVAYFSPEFGITELVPQYSGGLGILSGDHLKAASDLRVPLVGVGLFYRQGFFHQDVRDGTQVERYEPCDPADYGAVDSGATVAVPVGKRTVVARVWQLDVGTVPLLLLDTEHPDNHPDDRCIGDRLYGGDRRHRIRQEMVLGVGGARALGALGHRIAVHHLNEGHAGFLILELIDRRVRAGDTLADAVRAIGPGLVFTTHTPVPAGIDRFDRPLATEHLAPWAEAWDVAVAELLALGREESSVGGTAFNMANLCLRVAGRANGVSRLHGETSRELFADVDGGSAIGSVTNGVHARTWIHPPLQHVFDERLGRGWADGDPTAWAAVAGIDDNTIAALRADGRAVLAETVAARTGTELTPDALTVGFARRFATYKRADLLLRERDRLVALLADDSRPVQFVFAGKAHPADVPGKALLGEIADFASGPDANGRFVFVPDYDIAVAKAMYAGCDVWLNNPIRPREASGTSGEKSALNGGLNCSIPDGWWAEMADDRNGWTIPVSDADDPTVRDRAEADAVMTLLEDVIVPLFHAGPGPGPSREWIARVRHCWSSLGPKVTAARMVRDYRDDLYAPARAGSLV